MLHAVARCVLKSLQDRRLRSKASRYPHMTVRLLQLVGHASFCPQNIDFLFENRRLSIASVGGCSPVNLRVFLGYRKDIPTPKLAHPCPNPSFPITPLSPSSSLPPPLPITTPSHPPATPTQSPTPTLLLTTLAPLGFNFR